MHREFEELGVSVGGVEYGFFTGEAQFDESGQPVVIDLEASAFDRRPLRLDIEELVRERIALRRKLGLSFLEDGGYEVREHSNKWILFQTLAESLATRFADDISDFLVERRGGRGANAA